MFQIVKEFEEKVSSWFGSKNGIAVDSCTHGVELCLRLNNADKISVPKRTYISIPFLANKLNIPLEWRDEDWQDYYHLGGTSVIDAAVLWEKDSYLPNTFMCLSFQFQKHLSLGRGGMILTDNSSAAEELKKMSYDGRNPETPWREQNISSFGYHYYMTPETAKLGLDKLPEAFSKEPRRWTIEDWPDLTEMDVFRNG
jgi:dTDP-4-amino-4,6-dideoxygalactose transaminase